MKKTVVRIVCIVLVVLMVATIFTGAIGSLLGYAVNEPSSATIVVDEVI